MKFVPKLYLFSSSAGRILAVSEDETGADLPRLWGSTGWMLRGEIHPDKLPPDVVVTAYTKGFCMLEEDDLQPPTT